MNEPRKSLDASYAPSQRSHVSAAVPDQDVANTLFARASSLQTPAQVAAASRVSGLPQAWIRYSAAHYGLCTLARIPGESQARRLQKELSQALHAPVERHLDVIQGLLLGAALLSVPLAGLGLGGLAWALGGVSLGFTIASFFVLSLAVLNVAVCVWKLNQHRARHEDILSELNARQSAQTQLGDQWDSLCALDQELAKLSLPTMAAIELEAKLRRFDRAFFDPSSTDAAPDPQALLQTVREASHEDLPDTSADLSEIRSVLRASIGAR